MITIFNRYDMYQMYKLFRMNLRNRYLGSRMGLVWAILNPLLMMGLYIFIFGVMMNPEALGGNSLDYVVWFLCGFSPWMAISEGVTSTASCIISQSQIIKNFPIKQELLPLSAALMGAPQIVVGLVLAMILSVVSGNGLTLHVLWLPLILFIIFWFLSALGYFLAATTVFVRDILHLLGTVLMALLFMSPILNKPEALPDFLADNVFWNPIHQLIDPIRQVIYFHQNPDWGGMLYLVILCAVLWIVNMRYFKRLKRTFDSML